MVFLIMKITLAEGNQDMELLNNNNKIIIHKFSIALFLAERAQRA